MEYRNLGHSDLKVSRISLGCVTFGREINQQESYAIMDYALEKGMNYFDTAEAYGEGASELVIGSWMKERNTRPKIYLGTKILPPYSPDKIIKSCENSLERMQISEIDLYQLHAFHETALRPDVLYAFNKLIKDGKIRHLGISNFSPDQLRDFLKLQRDLGLNQICSLQNNHNLAIQNLNTEALDFCRQKGIGSISFSPLGAGFLTGKYKNSIPKDARFNLQPGHQDLYFNQDGAMALEKLEAAALETNISMVELALAWVLNNPEITTTLVGGRRISHIDQAFTAKNVAYWKSNSSL